MSSCNGSILDSADHGGSGRLMCGRDVAVAGAAGAVAVHCPCRGPRWIATGQIDRPTWADPLQHPTDGRGTGRDAHREAPTTWVLAGPGWSAEPLRPSCPITVYERAPATTADAAISTTLTIG